MQRGEMQRGEMQRGELCAYLDGLLQSAHFKDYCPNGLQVEGRDAVGRILCGVTASQALVDAAVERGADALLVHHGWFWKSDDARVTGFRRRRLATLLAHDINLIAYHLPLDAHAGLGNNAQWAKAMGWVVEGRFGDQEIGFVGVPGELASGVPARGEIPTLGAIAGRIDVALGRVPLVIGEAGRPVRRIAWCSGGAQGYFEAALATGADVFVSGEISEPTVHLARETGMAYIAAGHHATERFGVMALAQHLNAQFGLECEFLDIPNPV